MLILIMIVTGITCYILGCIHMAIHFENKFSELIKEKLK
jgi:hypothetical protein